MFATATPIRPPVGTDTALRADGSVITDAGRLGTVLGVWAHPDDEAFLSGGLMAAARDAGSRVVCVTATLGERGTPDPARWPPHRLAAVRGHEVRASLAALDVAEHHLLGIADGGCASAPFDAMVRHLGRVIDAVAPDTIVTFGPDGLTGHEDHQAVSAWATAARRITAPATRLIYATTTSAFVDLWEPARDAFDVFLADGLPLRTPPSELAVQLCLDPALLDRKVVSLRAQASQISGLIEAVGEERLRAWWATETFISAEAAQRRAPGWGTWRVAA
ncbi:MAG TPA: PIG-L family deacetylase [Pseudonocardia sp.]|jgi:LmbE family N-acetylglucosaminyl deacetylase